jgi:hypothetical protein
LGRVLRFFVFRRIHAACLVVAMALSATFAMVAVDAVGGRSAIHAGSNQPAVCPVTRPSLQIGRQTDGRPGMPLGTLVGLAVESPEFSLSPSWIRSARIDITSTVASAAAFSSRITRGPPAFVS